MLAILIQRAKEDGIVAGLIPHIVDRGVSILQYVDDKGPSGAATARACGKRNYEIN
jgi:hypothetical protein